MVLQFKMAARYLWGRKLRTFLTTLAVVFGTMVIFGINNILPTMMESFRANLLAAAGQVDVVITHTANESFGMEVLNKVRAVPGVRVAVGSLQRVVNIPTGFYGRTSKVTALALVGIDPRLAPIIHNYQVKQGRFLRPEDTNVAVITTSLADSLGLKLGGRLRLPTTEGITTLTIVGLLPPRTIPGNEEVLVTLAQAQSLLDMPGRINVIEANFVTNNAASQEAIKRKLEGLLDKNFRLGTMSSGTEIVGTIEIGQQFFNLIGFFSLFMGGFIIFNTFRTTVAERRHDIGLLRALGASKSTIIGLILTEGFLQGAMGTGVGIFLGYLLDLGSIALMSPLWEEYLNISISNLIVEPSTILITIVLGIGLTVLAGLLPAFNASRITPLEALRPMITEAGLRVSRRGPIIGTGMVVAAVVALLTGKPELVGLGGLFLLIGLVLVTPALVQPLANFFSSFMAMTLAREGTGNLAQGNVTRQPYRSAITASTTMIGLALIVGTGGMISSLSGSAITVLEKSMGSDYLLIPPSVGLWSTNVGASRGLADRLRAINGVAEVSTMRFAQSVIYPGGTAVSILGIDPVTFPKVSGLNFEQGDARTAYAQLASGRTLIINGVLAAQGKLKVGDVVTLATSEGERPYQVIAIANDYLNLKLFTAYISHANIQADFHKKEDVFIQINLVPGVDRAAVESRLRAILADYPQFSLISGQTYLEENKMLFNVVFSFFYVVLAVLALPSLIAILNTLAISIIERTREIGVLRAIGALQQQVSRMIVAESLLLASIGTSFGLLAGLYLGYIMVIGTSASGFPVTYSFPLGGLVAGTAIGLTFGVLAALIPARQAARLEIAQALRYE